jgi:hypothetical protein
MTQATAKRPFEKTSRSLDPCGNTVFSASSTMEPASRNILRVQIHRQQSRAWMKRSLNPILLALLITPAVVLPRIAQAASPGTVEKSETSAAADEEKMFDEKLREFGYWSGAAFGCVSEDRKGEVERRILETYHRIARLFGTDRAFFYAAAFGRGTTIEVERAKCPEFLRKFEAATVVQDELKSGKP